ncbi:hypothetical protein WMZ97_11520 [Lentibacillus sp. N15]|uniref:hypothetical protein n=1 Tax=Lentibacillus songyuanensis TaxID=3136161 RepID=UPI0031BAB297
MNHFLSDSMESKRKIMIFYMDDQYHVTQRIIRVLRVERDTVTAFCYWRKRVRTFRLDRILAVGPIGKRSGVS